MDQIINDNLLLLQSIVGSLIVFVIILVFKQYFKKRYLALFSYSWGLLVLANLSYLSYLLFEFNVGGVLYILMMLMSAFYYFKAIVFFDDDILYKRHYIILITVIFILLVTITLNIENYYKLFVLSILSSGFYLFSSIRLIKMPQKEYRIFGLFLIGLVVSTISSMIFKDLQFVFVSSLIQSLFGLGTGIGVLLLFSIKQQELEETTKRELYRLSYLDTLTGCYNRTYLDKIILKDKPKAYTVMMLDLNNLKEFNDQFGHDVGDLAIINVAKVLVKSINRNDFVVRRGGDEFIVFMSPRSEIDLEILKNNIRETIEKNKINDYKINVAIGYSNNSFSYDILLQMKDAEKNMYIDKKMSKLTDTSEN